MSIVMKTERLHLREVEGADLVSLGRIYADPECMRFYPATKSPSEIGEWFQKLAFDSYTQHGFGLWAVVDTVSGRSSVIAGSLCKRHRPALSPKSVITYGANIGEWAWRPKRLLPAVTMHFKLLVCVEW